jgi:hypothetical protein
MGTDWILPATKKSLLGQVRERVARKIRTGASGREFVRIPVNFHRYPKINQFFLLTGFSAFSGFITVKPSRYKNKYYFCISLNKIMPSMRELLFLFAMLAGIHLSAQNEVAADTIPSPDANNIKMSGAYMLDMNLFMPPKLPSFSMNTDLLGPDATKDYVRLFLLPSQMTLSKSYISAPFHSSSFLQAATFKLNGNMRLSTYGQYMYDGKRIPNPGVLPWEKSNFMGGMELKFNNRFGIRIEVQQGGASMYPH